MEGVSDAIRSVADAVNQTDLQYWGDKFVDAFFVFLAALLAFLFALSQERRSKRIDYLKRFMGTIEQFHVAVHGYYQDIKSYNELVQSNHLGQLFYQPTLSHAQNSPFFHTARVEALKRIGSLSKEDTIAHDQLEKLVLICKGFEDFDLIINLGSQLHEEATSLSMFIPLDLKMEFDNILERLNFYSSGRLRDFHFHNLKSQVTLLILHTKEEIDRRSNPLNTHDISQMYPLTKQHELVVGDVCRYPGVNYLYKVREVVDTRFSQSTLLSFHKVIIWRILGGRTGDLVCESYFPQDRRILKRAIFRRHDLVPITTPGVPAKDKQYSISNLWSRLTRRG